MFDLFVVIFQETKWYDETTVELMAPTMLPELHLLKRVKPHNTSNLKQSLCKSCMLKMLPHLFSKMCLFVAGEGERTPLLGIVSGPQQGHGAFKVRVEIIHS